MSNTHLFVLQYKHRFKCIVTLFLTSSCCFAEYLNRKFVEYLVNIVEEPPCGKDDEDRVVNAFVPMILSFNQHFEGEIFKNIVALKEILTYFLFTEKPHILECYL